ncbi:putative toxin-antitoxin system toxin component, PIN family [Sinomicrobium kalidii]|uniref:putative toxin-antitoxin system toxin component, PIN family n=1 Tax=Sinomicrobium kalidii TaxID=2900738 RepID=UPI001E28C152|nr:putative toxin-antitoxin system toxin component, PIN family [Sinomicrobium kalidii]UGU17510.1 putative toxin-antitoxin system toxin component, PIN family [Sinomicrobium kalidii]
MDCNVLISAHLIKNSVSRRAYEKALLSGIAFCSPATFQEFSTRFLRSKFDKYLPLDQRLIAIARYKRESKMINPTNFVDASRDPDDNKYLELAIATNAACIVSGDKDLLVLHPFQDIPIITAADFLARY